jgi:polysaccharide export outer membrane protein
MRIGLLFSAAAVMSAVLVFAGGSRSDAAVDDQYRINPGDVLQVTVWKEDGLDREVLVLPDGSIQFPLVGNLQAGGKTVSVLENELKARLSAVIPDNSVSVAVKAALGHTVDVIGQVNKPGELTLGHRTTVMQALSIAGGLTPFASHSILILRRDGDSEKSISFPYDDVSSGDSLDRDIVLNPGDVIVVPAASIF